MHHDIGGTGCRLIGRQREGALGIQDGKLAAAQVAVESAFVLILIAGDHARITHLAASCGNRQHGTEGQTGFRCNTFSPEIPRVAVIAYAIADSLRRVDHRSAANGQNEVHAFPAAQFNTFFHFGEQRIGHHASQFHVGDACL